MLPEYTAHRRYMCNIVLGMYNIAMFNVLCVSQLVCDYIPPFVLDAADIV